MEIAGNTFDWNKQKNMSDALESISKAEFVKFYNKTFFSDQTRRINLCLKR